MLNFKRSVFFKIWMVFWLTTVSLVSISQGVIPTKGTEFWVGYMDNFNGASALELFITSNESTSGTVSIPQQGWTLDFNVQSNQTTTVYIPSELAEHQGENQVISNKGILVETADTVSVFAINFTQYTADGSKILPTKALGTEYRITSYTGLPGWGSELLIVATEDDTEIEITPTVDTEGGNPAGVPFIIGLDRGQSYQIAQVEADDDLTGTLIRATENSGSCKPFAVYSGVSCANIPVGCSYCDHIFDQNFPTVTWGTDYHVVPYGFSDGITYRVLAHQDGTSFTTNGSNNISLNAGEFYEANNVNSPVCISSNLPVSVAQFMQGTTCSGTGDPAMLFLNDASQKIDHVTFSTVVSSAITNHGVDVIMYTSDINSLTLDGVPVNASEFAQFPSCPEKSYAQLLLSPGSHTLDSPAGFTAYAFGLGEAESYSYSVGSFNQNPLNLDIEQGFCTESQVLLDIEENAETEWYHYDFPEDILGNSPALVLDPPLTPGVYVAEYNSLLSGCPQTKYFSVEVPEPPVITPAAAEFTICQYDSVKLELEVSPPNSFYEYEWTPTIGLSNSSSISPVASPLFTTEYELTVTSPTGCASASSSALLNVVGGHFSNLQLRSTEEEICVGHSSLLTASIFEVDFEDDFDLGLNPDLWLEINSGTPSTDCGSMAGSALYFNGAGGRSITTIPIDLSSGASVSFDLKYGDSTFPCDKLEIGENIVLEYSTNGTSWVELEEILVGSISGWEHFKVQLPETASTSATQLRWRQIAHSGNDQDNWSLDNISISSLSSERLDFSWYDGEELIASNTDSLVVFPEENTTYAVEFIDTQTGCTYKDSVSIVAEHSFELETLGDTAICESEEVIIQAIPQTLGDYTFEWFPNDGSVNVIHSGATTVTPASSTVYSVTVSDENNCTNSGEVNIIVSPPLELLASISDSTICFGDSVFLHAEVLGNPAGISYAWTPENILSQPSNAQNWALPSEDVTFQIEVTDTLSGCSVQEEISVSVTGNYTVDLGEDVLLCNAKNHELQAVVSEPGDYLWEWQPAQKLSSSNSSSAFLLENESGEFIVEVTENGCSQRDTIHVETAFEHFSLGEDQTICSDEYLELSTGFPSAEHLWNTGETTESISVSSEQVYWVNLISDFGCSITDSVYLSVSNSPQIDLGPDLELCQGDTLTLDALNPASEYLWSTGSEAQQVELTQSGNYSVSVVNQYGCENSDEIELVFFEVPVSVLPSDSIICEDQTVILDAQNIGSTYVWSLPNQNSQFLEVNEPGMYSVEITNQGTCSIIDTFNLQVLAYPDIDLGDDIIACDGGEVVLDANAPEGVSVLWSTQETSEQISVFESGSYEVFVDNGRCFTSDQIGVFFKPKPDVNLPLELEICFDDLPYSVDLDASFENGTYSWNDGSTESNLKVTEEGIYTVEVTSEFGCDSVFSSAITEFCYGSYLYVPNSFSPGADGLNDGWRAEGEHILDIHVQVFNRWGMTVFESEDINEYWIGNDRRGDYYCPDGVYSYRIRYRYLNKLGNISEWRERTGNLFLLR